MKYLLLIVLISSLFSLNKAAEMRGFYTDPNHPGKCVVDDVILSPGEEIRHPSPKCSRVMCGENGFVTIHTCGVLGPPEGHKLGDPIEPDEPYPKCCMRHFVPIEEDN